MAFIISLIPTIIIIVIFLNIDKDNIILSSIICKILFLSAIFIVPIIIIGNLLEIPFCQFKYKYVIIYNLIDNFLLIGFIEEFFKFFAVYLVTKGFKKVNYPPVILIYGIISASSFAIVENFLYMIDEGILLAVLRGVFSAPSHIIFTIITMLFCLKKIYNKSNNKFTILKGLFFASWIHGCNNFCLDKMSESNSLFAYIYLFLFIPLILFLIYKILFVLYKSYKDTFKV